jgi:hypothetical protein
MPSILALALTSAFLLYRKIPGNALSTSLSASARSDDKSVKTYASEDAEPPLLWCVFSVQDASIAPWRKHGMRSRFKRRRIPPAAFPVSRWVWRQGRWTCVGYRHHPETRLSQAGRGIWRMGAGSGPPQRRSCPRSSEASRPCRRASRPWWTFPWLGKPGTPLYFVGATASALASKLFSLPLVAASFSLSRRRQQSGSSTMQQHPRSSLLTFLRRSILSRNCLLFSQARCARHSRSALWVHSTRLLSSRVGGGRVISSGGICISGVVCRDMAGVVGSCKTFSGTP